MLPWFLRSALDSTPPLSSTLLSPSSLFLFIPPSLFLLRLSFFLSAPLSRSFSPHVYNSLSSFLFGASILHSLPLSLSLIFPFYLSYSLFFYISPAFSLCHLFFSVPLHPSLPLLHIFSLFACLRHSDDSDTKLAIPQIVTASYCTINFSHNVSVFQKFLQSLIQAQVLLFNFEKLFIFVCARHRIINI